MKHCFWKISLPYYFCDTWYAKFLASKHFSFRHLNKELPKTVFDNFQSKLEEKFWSNKNFEILNPWHFSKSFFFFALNILTEKVKIFSADRTYGLVLVLVAAITW